MEPYEYSLMDIAEQDMWWYRALHMRLFDKIAISCGRLLDAGCGTGGFLAKARDVRPDLQCVGLEFDQVAAVRAAEKSGATVRHGSVNAMPFGSAEFDIVVSADVLCHKSVDPKAALSEMRRVLKPKGYIVINMPAFSWMYSAHDIHVHTRERVTAYGLRQWLESAGFANVSTHYWNSILFPLMALKRKVIDGPNSPSGVSRFPHWQDALFFGATQLERKLPFHLPIGGSVMAVARPS
jgi:ubiquinone/menaquinone biosynthesis C-methylase UbiE